jgi:hypothetical protein
MVALLSESGWRREKTKKLRLRSLHQKGSRKLLDILVDLTLKELGLVNEDYLTIFNRARAVHERGDQEAHRIWRQTVKRVAS